MAVKLVEITRGKLIEGTHTGNIVVVGEGGLIKSSLGDAKRWTFFRSAAKPILALAVLEAGVIEKFGLTGEEIAIISSSHAGEKRHIDVLEHVMKKIGADENDLQCGVHAPYNKQAARELYMSGQEPGRIHCNCSGKHLGLLAAIQALGLSKENYRYGNHPIYKYIEKYIAELCQVDVKSIVKSVDGCGIPVFAVPLYNMAIGYSNLVDLTFKEGKYCHSQKHLINAITSNPFMIGGTERLDSVILERFGDRLLGKSGSEGLYCCGLLHRKLGIAVKIEDGNLRAVGPAILETLRKLGIITDNELEEIRDYWTVPVKNLLNEVVGEIRPTFTL